MIKKLLEFYMYMGEQHMGATWVWSMGMLISSAILAVYIIAKAPVIVLCLFATLIVGYPSYMFYKWWRVE